MTSCADRCSFYTTYKNGTTADVAITDSMSGPGFLSHCLCFMLT